MFFCGAGLQRGKGHKEESLQGRKPTGKKKCSKWECKETWRTIIFEKTPQLAVIKRAKEGDEGENVYGTQKAKTPICDVTVFSFILQVKIR